MNGVQTRLKCKPNVKRCKRFVFAAHSPLLHPNTLKTKAIIHFQTDHILTRFVFPPLPTSILDKVKWTDNQGNEGYVNRNDFYTTNSYYPLWIEENEMTFHGSRLKNNAVNEPREDMPEHWVGYCYPYGYADNHPNNTEKSKFQIDWAVDKNGHPVQLDGIDFVRIYTAVNQNTGWMGEISTEIQAIEDLHFGKQ